MMLASVFLAFILSLLSERVQCTVRQGLGERSGPLLAAIVLAAIFCGATAFYGALSWQLAAVLGGYVLLPTTCIVLGSRPGDPAGFWDLCAIVALWLPLELAVGASLVPRPAQGVVHAIAYGVALTLALLLFLIYRRLPGIKFNLPRSVSDLTTALVGFLLAALILIPAGLAVGFLGPPHVPGQRPGFWVVRIALIFVATALPEEILFRGLIQNWLTQRFGNSNLPIALAALVFGLSHLNNAPGPPPNWRYAFLATLAGFLFGKVFQRSTSVLASAAVHAGVNATKHMFF
jgi:membrane protease YdiL (CAAX protease family)